MNQPNSAQISPSLRRVGVSYETKTKKKLDAALTCRQQRPSCVALSGCIGCGCNGHFASFVHPRTLVEMEKDYHFLVSQLRNTILEINAKYLKKLQDGPVGDLYFLGKKDKQFQNGEIESCNFSS